MRATTCSRYSRVIRIKLIDHNLCIPILKNYMILLLGDIFEKLSSLHPQKFVRVEFYSLVFAQACHLEHTPCVEMSQKWFSQWMTDPNNFQL